MPLATIPLTRALPATLVVCVLAGLPALLIASGLPASGSEASYLAVTSGLLALAAGITSLVSWRIVGLVWPGWLGVGLVALGVLTFTEASLSTFGLERGVGAQPFDQLVIVTITGSLLVHGLRGEEVDAGFSPFVALVLAIGVGIFVLGFLSLLQSRRMVPTTLTGTAGHTFFEAAAATAWFAVAGVIWRRRQETATSASAGAPPWVVGVASMLGVAVLLLVFTPAATWWTIVSAAVGLFALALAFGAALGQVQELIRSEDRLRLHLGRALDDTRHQAAIEHEGVEELLHDLRNAVAGLRAADAVMRQSGNEATLPAQAMLADAVTAEIARLEVLIEPARPLEVRELVLGAVLAPVVATERSHGATIAVRLGDARVRADAETVAEVVQNLLANARRYAPGSTVLLSADRAGHMVELSVHDGGPGIPPHERMDVFRRGVRGSTSAGTEGNGLGLYLARRLLQTIGGSIRLAADDGRGSRFVVSLPVAGPAGDVGASGAGGAVASPGRGSLAPVPAPTTGNRLRPAS